MAQERSTGRPGQTGTPDPTASLITDQEELQAARGHAPQSIRAALPAWLAPAALQAPSVSFRVSGHCCSSEKTLLASLMKPNSDLLLLAVEGHATQRTKKSLPALPHTTVKAVPCSRQPGWREPQPGPHPLAKPRASGAVSPEAWASAWAWQESSQGH